MDLPVAYRDLSNQERAFVYAYSEGMSAEAAKAHAGYRDNASASYLLRRPHIATAIRHELTRLMATEGAQLGFRTLKRVCNDDALPAAARVAAAKALLQGAGLLDAPKTGPDTKSINDMDQGELRAFIESKRAEIDKLESAIASRATDVTPKAAIQVSDMLK